MRVLIAGGGTGGHTSPASAIIEELRQRDPGVELLWVGKAGAIEERVAAANGVAFQAIPAVGWPRGSRPRQVLAALRFLRAIVAAARVVRRFRPDALVGVGGYVSLPPLLAAQLLRLPTFIHEQNRRLGMANRILGKRATRIFLSYESTIGGYPEERALVTGNPVRAAFATPPSRAQAKARLGLSEDTLLVLVVGGSQGAQSVNAAIAALLQAPPMERVRLLWMTGRHGVEDARAAAAASPWDVEVAQFIEDMATTCAASDLIISRAGASSTAEIAAVGRASILVPYPYATDDHQTRNAEVFVETGAALLVPDARCVETIPRLVPELLSDTARREKMEQAATTLARPHAAETIVDAMRSALGL